MAWTPRASLLEGSSETCRDFLSACGSSHSCPGGRCSLSSGTSTAGISHTSANWDRSQDLATDWFHRTPRNAHARTPAPFPPAQPPPCRTELLVPSPGTRGATNSARPVSKPHLACTRPVLDKDTVGDSGCALVLRHLPLCQTRAELGLTGKKKIPLWGSTLLWAPLLGSLLATMAVHPYLRPSAFVNLPTKTENSPSPCCEELPAGHNSLYGLSPRPPLPKSEHSRGEQHPN